MIQIISFSSRIIASGRLDIAAIYVGSVISYGSEILGFHKSPEIKRLHLSFCKNGLGVRRNVCNYMFNNDLNRRLLILQ